MSAVIRRARSPHGVLMVAGLIACLAAMAMAALSSSANAASKTFNVLFVTPLSGPLSVIGKAEDPALRGAADLINRKYKGINKQKVVVDVRDDSGDGAKSTAAALQALNEKKYNLVVCGSTGDSAVPCSKAIARNPALQIPSASDARMNDPKNLPRTFNAGSPPDPAIRGVIEKMKKDGVKKFAIINADNSVGRQYAGVAAIVAKKEKMTITDTIFVPPSVTDATPYVQKADSSGADAFVSQAFTAANPRVITARHKLGIKKKLYLDWYASSANLTSLTADQRAGVISQVWPWMVKGNKAQKTVAFKTVMKQYAKFNNGSTATPIAVTAIVNTWDILLHVMVAAKKAKSTDGNKMAKAIERIPESKAVPYFVGSKLLYSPRFHAYRTTSKEFTYINAGTMADGIITPG